MANAYSYSFSKRHNSTAQPTGGTLIDVQLKGGCDILAPVFILNYSGVPTFNYMSFEGRYYFVTGIKSVRQDLFEVSCEVDVLATWKAAITGSSQYVLYYTHANTEIVDRRLSTKTAITIQSDTEQFNNLGGGNSYMLTAVGSQGTKIYACGKSAVDDLFINTTLSGIKTTFEDAIDDFITDILNPATFGSVEDAIKGFLELYLLSLKVTSHVSNTLQFAHDAAQFVKNCYVLPIAPTDIGGQLADIYLGQWISNTQGNRDFPRIVHDSATVSIPWQASDWRRNAPYHELYLYIPYIGLIPLPASELIGVTNITVNVAVDTYSGVTSFVVNADNGAVIGQYSTNIAAPYAIGASNIDIVSSGAEIASSGMALIGNALMGNAAGALAGSIGMSNSIKPFDASIASNGGAAGMGLGNTVKIFSVFHDTTVSPASVSAVKGTPYNGVMSLSGVSGYVQCSDASVAGSMTDTEREEINNLLNGGVYIE